MDPQQGNWGLAHRVAFRFVFAYLVLYNFESIFILRPSLAEHYANLWHAIVVWMGRHLLHLREEITVLPNGSGDTTFNYVQVLAYVILAVFATVVWSSVDRRRPSYRTLHGCLRIFVRYVLLFTMLTYGLSKVLRHQFPPLGADSLLESYGESSPMRLLWTFMSFSAAYCIFTGVIEVLGGLLLIFRRTTTLGALIVMGSMVQVLMLNLSYDVPVKLYSTHLILMAVFLLAPDAPRLARVFVLNRPTEAVDLEARYPTLWMRRAALAVKVGVLAFCLYTVISNEREAAKYFSTPPPQLAGLYQVQEFERSTPAPVDPEEPAWARVAVGRNGWASIRLSNGALQLHRLTETPDKQGAELRRHGEPSFSFTYSMPDGEHVVLDGTAQGGDPVHVRLERFTGSEASLMRRGFHWVNEYPLNQ